MNRLKRQTVQREIIRQIFSQATRPLHAQDLVVAARRRRTPVGIATVYRNLNELVLEGWLSVVKLAGEPARYERASLPHHHHFYCNKCSQVFDLPGCVQGISAMLPKGFQASHHDLTIYGACANCN